MLARSVWMLALVIGASPVSAQVARGAFVQGNGATPAAPSRATAQRVTVAFDNVLLADAVRTIVEQSGAEVMYSARRLPNVRVSYTGTRVTVETALTEVVRGTAVRLQRADDGTLALVLSASASAQQGSVEGTVLNAKTKQPVAGATVMLDGETKGVMTDEKGHFRLPTNVGTQTIVVRAVGFTRKTVQAAVVEGRASALTVELDPSASVLNEVIVTGTVVATERKAIPTPITVITAEDIEKRGITRIDQLFRGEVPGVISLDRGTQMYSATLGEMASSQVFARGSASLTGAANPLKTYVDGVELVDPAYLGTLDPKSIERIEIVTGPQAATIYGSGAMGGVMQIFTKKGSARGAPELTLNVKYGMLQSSFSDGYTPSHNDALLVTGGSGPGFMYSGNISYQYTGQWQPALFARIYGVSIGMTHTRGSFIMSGSASLTAGRNGTATAPVGYLNPINGGVYGSLIEKAWYEDGTLMQDAGTAGFMSQQLSGSSNQTYSLNLDYRPSAIWQHHVTLGRSQNAFDMQPIGPRFVSPTDTLFRASNLIGQRITLGYNTTLLPRVGPFASTLTVGATGSWGKQMEASGCLPTSVSTLYVGCVTGDFPRITRPADTKSWGGFGSAQIGVWDQLFFTFSLRGEHNPNYGRAHRIDWTPTTGLTYTLEYGDATLKLLTSYGSATRPPLPEQRLRLTRYDATLDPIAFTYQVESPDLRPQYSRGPQGGIELYYGNIGSLTVSRYVQTVSDLIQAVPVDSMIVRYVLYGFGLQKYVVQNRNVATIRQQGWSGTGSLNLGPLALKGTYSWDDARITRSYPGAQEAYYSVGQAFYGIPTHTGNVTATYAHGPTSLTWVVNYVGSSHVNNSAALVYRLQTNARLKTYLPNLTSFSVMSVSPAYAKSDFAASHRLTSWASATLNVTNVGNNVSSDVSELMPSLGRQTLFGLSLRYPTTR